jgi:hypothetical protein
MSYATGPFDFLAGFVGRTRVAMTDNSSSGISQRNRYRGAKSSGRSGN